MIKDRVDLNHLEETTSQRGYQILCERVQQMLARKVELLAGDAAPLATAKLRGEIGALRTVLELPEILKSEFLSKGKQRIEAIRQ